MNNVEPILIVTGLPRSGTSLMMQILQAGGVPLLTDSNRPPDVSNPRGYFEYEKVKWLAANNSWLAEARGKAVKVITQLVPFLPRGFRYQALLMRRDIKEILQSQAAMIQNMGMPPAKDPNSLGPIFERNLALAQKFLQQQLLATVESVDFRDLITSPEVAIQRVFQFLDRPSLDRQAMVRAIDTKLYRSRADGSTNEASAI